MWEDNSHAKLVRQPNVFSAEPAQIAEIKRLASGAVTPFYRRATDEDIQLFVAGRAGLLQTTEDVEDVWFEPCPGLTAAGLGVVSPENIAFTRWLTHLQNDVLLDEQNCLMLHELWWYWPASLEGITG